MKNHIKMPFLMAIITFITVFAFPIDTFAITKVTLNANEYVDLTSYESIEILAETPWVRGYPSENFAGGGCGYYRSALTADLIDSKGNKVKTIDIGGGYIHYTGSNTFTNPTTGYIDVSELSGEYKIVTTTSTVTAYDWDGTLEIMLTLRTTSSLKSIFGYKYDSPKIDTNLAE